MWLSTSRDLKLGSLIKFYYAPTNRLQHVWLSTSRDLKLDADRDLGDLGMHGIKVRTMQLPHLYSHINVFCE